LYDRGVARNRARNPARYLAPLALAGAIVAGYLVVHNGLRDASSTTTTGQTAATLHQSPLLGGPSKRARGPHFYVVHAGDTLLSIAHKTKVSMPALVALNPGLNPNVLRTGQRLRLRR
jgi:LysM repeat protein